MATDAKPQAAADADDELFGKLDQLMSRHQGRPVRSPNLPTLTESVERSTAPAEPEIPLLSDVVDPATESTDTLVAKRRKLQVALYVRLRQKLDHAFHSMRAAKRMHDRAPDDPMLIQIEQDLRAALPRIVRDTVDQVLAGFEAGDRKL